ncbi:retrotran gag 3 domain-containing protein [Citrus sinensis]|uniref:Retrotran gag 3 domain-containing protein n=1 Tax=Citrus sinensis TaxID=2711 RepID=A0ACB8JJE5_CITSI|nr:retrotran gag 3 domain-containing protein [Citrus sinensis]
METKSDTSKVSDEHVKNQISPYCLLASDNPGNIITQKFGFVDGSMKEPSKEPELDDWWTVNSMIVSWILNTIEPTLRSTITHTEVAKKLWDDIKERFLVGNGPRVHQLKSKLAECKQRGMTLLSYYGKLKLIWVELANYEQYPIYSCEGCTCELEAKLNKKREEERLHQFLMGLDDTIYGSVRSNILSIDPLPPLNRAYSLVVQEERVQTITRRKEGHGEPIAFAIREKSSVICTHCKKTGHDADSYLSQTGGRGAGRGQGGQRQGIAQEGKGRGSQIKANASHVTSQGIKGLSNEQWSMLLNFLNSQTEKNQEKLNGPHFEDTDWCG